MRCLKMLPPNKPQRDLGVTLPYRPRPIERVQFAGNYYNTVWCIYTLAVSMPSLRESFGCKYKENWVAQQNLQIWINNLGDALYNPLRWFLGPHRRRTDGNHRMRVMEALDFDFAYVYVIVNHDTLTPQEWTDLSINDRAPKLSSRWGQDVCKRCGYTVMWKRYNKMLRGYECEKCNQQIYAPYVFPEPV